MPPQFPEFRELRLTIVREIAKRTPVLLPPAHGPLLEMVTYRRISV